MSDEVEPITVLTPVYLNRPERLEYLLWTLGSFYRCCRYPGELRHVLIDDRSPEMTAELSRLCMAFGIRALDPIRCDTRRGYFDAYRSLLAAVDTRFFLFLEPDHYFFARGDFLTPVLRLFAAQPDLLGVYLRAPMTYQQFRRATGPDGDVLVTYDGSRLCRVPIDAQNTGWVGRGQQHEGFSLMPTVWRTTHMREYFLRDGFWLDVATPHDLEQVVDRDWAGTRLTGYLNAQAFCYHIGALGGMGGGHTRPGDERYERVWSAKQL
jgi:hypothetical protein